MTAFHAYNLSIREKIWRLINLETFMSIFETVKTLKENLKMFCSILYFLNN